MRQDAFNIFCAALPHAFHVSQWGGADVWKVGTTEKFKVFAIGGWQDKDQAFAITFKTSEIGFEMLRDAPGCKPAPYLASRGMKWIQCFDHNHLSDTDLKDYLKNSHRLAAQNLTKKLQKELGLNQEGG